MWKIIETDALDKRKFMIYIAFVALIASVCAQGDARRRPDVDPPRISAQTGVSKSLMCRFASPITGCKFVIPGIPLEIKLNPRWPPRTDNFRYNGSGLEHGECGITIMSIHRENHGNASCIIDLGDESPDIIGNIEIIILAAPQPPELEVAAQNLEAHTELEARCTARDGRPEAEIQWFINERQIPGAQYDVSETVDKDGSVYSTAVSTVRFQLTPEDDGARLICRAVHPGYTNGKSETVQQLNVKYRPVALAEQYVGGLEIGRTAVVSIRIRANPRPSLKWVAGGQVVDEGAQIDRFVAAQPISLGDGYWNASLTITQLTLQDTVGSYSLRASNLFGTTDYKIRIGSAPAAEADSLGIVSIIAIAIISLFVIVTIALTVVAKVTKRWCFAGDSMHPNGPDSEAHISPEDDTTHEQYEQHDNKMSEDEEHGAGDAVTKKNGNSKGNTSV